jgi:glutamine synthetase
VADIAKRAEAFRDKVFVAMSALRKDIDALEGLVSANLWPVPTYAEMLFKL